MLTAIVCGQASPDSRQTALTLYKAMNREDSFFKPLLITPEKSSPDLACMHSSGLLDYFRLWFALRKHVELLIVAIGTDSLKLAKRIARMCRKGAAQLTWVVDSAEPPLVTAREIAPVQLCICSSAYVRQSLEAVCRGDCVVEAPGMDLEPFPEDREQCSSRERFVFGMAESLQPGSGALLVIRAMSALWQHQDIPPWEARLFGYGPRFEEIMAEARKLGVLSRISILGTQPLGEVTRYCHVWLAPGDSPIEQPQTLWAGFAAGLPVICAESELHKERVWNDSAILQVSRDNPQELAKAMLSLMRDRQLAEKIAKAGRQMRPKISLEAMGDRICRSLRLHSAKFRSAGKPA